MDAKRLADGRLRVPARAEGDDGMIGDGMVTIGPGDPNTTSGSHGLTKSIRSIRTRTVRARANSRNPAAKPEPARILAPRTVISPDLRRD